MHSPTLLTLAAILTALITSVLYAVWFFNKTIPGLRLWMLSFLFGSVFSVSLLVRDWVPEVFAVMISQAAISIAAYFCLLASRNYMGRQPVSHVYGVVGIGVLISLSVYFTVVQPHLGMRFLLAGLGSGICFLLTAFTLAKGELRRVPARYLLAMVAGLHGTFLLLRPVFFKLALPANASGQMDVNLVSQFVVLEAILAVVLLGFGALILTNEFITSELRHLAEVDPLTNVFNRRAFLTLLDKAISSAERTQTAVPVLVMDLDHFKKVNDTWGHRAGDDVLRHFVVLANRCLRNEDVLGRLGGEEFAIFLPNAGGGGAIAVAERLRALIEAHPLVTDQRPIHLTVSVGVTLCAHGDTADAALQRADEAMYLAKERGRNRVEVLAKPAAVPDLPVAMTAA
ncbi:MAG: GGDEF domain-containing protein [Gammaproteobacteria bacterium]|nr:GGDEF domain-containing protein [Gammaproteobacteria bacterium]MBU1506337.1 GGDEF domain-containing protein [Gammaproteobacteria bacterium]MBU2123384.1 GGDEF domain-containing protein [Gammaproteobacteria bacterium]MBU2169267.1 GGDEF domain-containing protein [Gammaproteobacteria bacterium]MBU2201418.1 GGDEF domain-containing protein [Gammaproteobacteria bacterium]